MPNGGVQFQPPEMTQIPQSFTQNLPGAIGYLFNKEGIELEGQMMALRENPDLARHIAESQRRMHDEGISEEAAAQNLDLFGVDRRFAPLLIEAFPRTVEQEQAALERKRGLPGERVEEEFKTLRLSGVKMDMETEELMEFARRGGPKLNAAVSIAALHQKEELSKFQLEQLLTYGTVISEMAVDNPEAPQLAALALTNPEFFRYIMDGRMAESAANRNVTSGEILELYLPLASEIRMVTDQMMDAVDAGDENALRSFAVLLDNLYQLQGEVLPDMPIIMTREKRKLFGGIRVITERLTPLTVEQRLETWSRDALKRALDRVDAGSDIETELGHIESSQALQAMSEEDRASTMSNIRQWLEDVESEIEPKAGYFGPQVTHERATELSQLSNEELLRRFYSTGTDSITREEFFAARGMATGRITGRRDVTMQQTLSNIARNLFMTPFQKEGR